MSTTPDPCPICGVSGCGGLIYQHMVDRYTAGHDREHWRRIHDREKPTPEDLALRRDVEKGGGCC